MQIQNDRYPDIDFLSVIKSETLSGKIYTGLFLAICLFLAFLFGNLLFTILVVILSMIIMLSYDEEAGNVICKLTKNEISQGTKIYMLKDIKYFTILDNEAERENWYLKLSFQNYINPNVYIRLHESVQKETLYAILDARLEQNPSQKLSFVEMIMLRFM